MSVFEHDQMRIRLASKAQLLNLLNITVFPIIAFLILLQHRKEAVNQGSFVKQHVSSSVNASIWAGILLIAPVAFALIAWPGGDESKWMFIILYFVSVHSGFIILAVLAYARALGGKSYNFLLPKILSCNY